eukprot:scaffold1610_cov257-Pinguiococcus_pyrenoidosus.AAC.30
MLTCRGPGTRQRENSSRPDLTSVMLCKAAANRRDGKKRCEVGAGSLCLPILPPFYWIPEIHRPRGRTGLHLALPRRAPVRIFWEGRNGGFGFERAHVPRKIVRVVQGELIPV